jgi:hypothetical protein
MTSINLFSTSTSEFDCLTESDQPSSHLNSSCPDLSFRLPNHSSPLQCSTSLDCLTYSRLVIQRRT